MFEKNDSSASRVNYEAYFIVDESLKIMIQHQRFDRLRYGVMTNSIEVDRSSISAQGALNVRTCTKNDGAWKTHAFFACSFAPNAFRTAQLKPYRMTPATLLPSLTTWGTTWEMWPAWVPTCSALTQSPPALLS